MATLTTGLLGGGLRGVSGNAVFVETPRGTVVRDRTTPHDPQTPLQRAARARQAQAARAWMDLEPQAVARWTAWARTRALQPNNAFATLYKVLLRLDPETPPPAFPPATAFFGDAISVSAFGSPSFRSGERRGPGGGEGEPFGALRPPRALVIEGGEGAVVFESGGPNAPGVVTELLVQPLLSRHRRTYPGKYRHAAYHAFPAASTVDVPCAAGWTACAYRFVNAATGEVTGLAEVGVVRAA